MDILMVHIFLIFFVLLNCIAPIYGSEVDKKLIIFTVKVALASDSLKYCDKKYIELIKKEYGVICNDNDPFIAVPEYKSIDARTQSIEERKNALDAFVNNVDCAFYNQQCAFLEQDLEYLGVYGSFKRLKEVTFLPFNLFYVRDDNRLTFKKEDSVLFSFKKHIENIEYEFEVRSKTDFDGGNPQDCLNRFKKLPLCMIGGFNGGNQKPGFIDTKPLEDELLNAGILAKDGEDIVHGPHGYSSEDIPKIILRPNVENFKLIYSGEKNRLCCKIFGMESEKNEIFSSVLRGSEFPNQFDIQNLDDCDSINKNDLDGVLKLFNFKAIPLRFILKGNQIKQKGNKFKQAGEAISWLIMTVNNNQYKVILEMPPNFLGYDERIGVLLPTFKASPDYYCDDEEELLKAGIIEKNDGKFIHGPKGHFEYKLPEQPIIKESPSSFFSLKNFIFCCAGLTGLVIISVIYLRSINPC